MATNKKICLVLLLAAYFYPSNFAYSQSNINLQPKQNADNFGYVDNTGTFVIPPKFTRAEIFCEGLAYVEDNSRSVEKDKRYRGFIDEKGNLVIKLPDNLQAYWFCDEKYEQGKAGFKNGLFKVCGHNKYGYNAEGFINKKGELIVPTVYNVVNDFKEGFAAVKQAIYDEATQTPIGFKFQCGYVDTLGELAIPLKYGDAFDFSEGAAKVSIGGFMGSKKNHKYGFVDKNGKEIIAPKYEEAFDCHEGMMRFTQYTLFGFADKNGNEVIPATYISASDFINHDGKALAQVVKVNKPYCIDKSGNIDTQYTIKIYANYIGKFADGLASFVYMDENVSSYLFGYIDTGYNEIIKRQFLKAEDFKNGLAKVCDTTLKFGYINKSGERVVPCAYDSIGDFSEGVAWFFKNGKYGCVDKSGKEVIPAQFDGVNNFSEGLAMVKRTGGYTENVTQKYSDFDYQKIQRSYDTYGFIDKQGHLVIACKYTQASDFKNGKAKVFIPGTIPEFIDKTGKVISQ